MCGILASNKWLLGYCISNFKLITNFVHSQSRASQTVDCNVVLKGITNISDGIKQRAVKVRSGKRRKKTSTVTINVEMRDLCNTARKDPNARTIVPSKMDPAELARIAEICRVAEEQLNDIDDSDIDALEKIERIAECAASKI